MKLFEKSIALLLAIVAVTVLTTSSFASQLVVYQDTLRFTSGVGIPSEEQLYVWNSDSLSHTQMQARVWITGSGDFRLLSDSIVNFYELMTVYVQFDASSTTPSFGVLHIQGDSNTVLVTLIGTPPDHDNLVFTGEQYFGLLDPGVEKCDSTTDSTTLYNPNAFSVTVTNIWIDQQGTACSLSGVLSTPFTLTAHASVTFDACITAPSRGVDTIGLSGTIHADYTYATGSDSALYSIDGFELPLDSTCLSFSNLDLGAFPDGSTTNQNIHITNTTAGSVTVDSITLVSGDVAQFSIAKTQFPITLLSGGQANVSVLFSVPSDAPEAEMYQALIAIYSSGTSKMALPCKEMTETLTGQSDIPIVDTVTLDAPPGGASTVSVSTNRTLSRHLIVIQNDTTVMIQPTLLQITDTSGIAWFEESGNKSLTLYDSIPAGKMNNYPIYLVLDVPDTGIFPIDMTLSYRFPIVHRKTEITSQPSYQYRVVVHRVPSAAASVNVPVQPAVDFALMPNPARGEVTISLPAGIQSTVEIYDVLGNLIMAKQVNGSFTWNGETTNGAGVSDGAYIVRVREVSISGEIRTASKQLMFVR